MEKGDWSMFEMDAELLYILHLKDKKQWCDNSLNSGSFCVLVINSFVVQVMCLARPNKWENTWIEF